MEQQLNALEATHFLQTEGGLKPAKWRSVAYRLASKVCACCGKVFHPRKMMENGKEVAMICWGNWQKQKACSISCSKKLQNPMSNHQSRLKMRAKIREIRHMPIKRGGNGQLLPLPQLALLHALGEGWESEVSMATKMGHRNGTYPNHNKIDVANKNLMIGIELDGASHGSLERKSQDAKKTDILIFQGWSIYRVSNERALQLYSTFTSVDTLLTSLMES